MMTEKEVVVAEELTSPAVEIIHRYTASKTVITCEGKTIYDAGRYSLCTNHIPTGTRLTISDDGLGQEKVVETLALALSGHTVQHYRASRQIPIANAEGIHARPAMMIVNTFLQFMSEILLENSGLSVDGKSIMQMSMLAATHGTEFGAYAFGPDAIELLDILERVITVDIAGQY